ncbi:uncharacterized protein ACA1_324980 [Acanthamoeba castellanii str. Neff]|uniref:SprT-like domain-containing protein n=1 Tax=Acanthamoeba castellanii (strain ATCC 30010 / Neff) TaxID=1257118 RepID=L8GJT7_ACACF|nr:uncharacterized protein ACA1_324980 [Acanthamoeba castellanii str. Neff]ELR12451.1 hypothetical protein ACA1_324980 [Acanthamoeba castellanii str. Neff]
MPRHPNARRPFCDEAELQLLAGALNASIFDGRLPIHAIKVRWEDRLRTRPGRVKLCSAKGRYAVELNPRLVDDGRKVIVVLVHQLCHAAVLLIDDQPSGTRSLRYAFWVTIAQQKRPDLVIGGDPQCHAVYDYHYACLSVTEMHQKPCHIAYGSRSRLDEAAIARYRCRLCALPLVAIGSLDALPHDREIVYIQLARKTRTRPPSLGAMRLQIAAEAVGAALQVGMASVDALWPAILPGVASTWHAMADAVYQELHIRPKDTMSWDAMRDVLGKAREQKTCALSARLLPGTTSEDNAISLTAAYYYLYAKAAVAVNVTKHGVVYVVPHTPECDECPTSQLVDLGQEALPFPLTLGQDTMCYSQSLSVSLALASWVAVAWLTRTKRTDGQRAVPPYLGPIAFYAIMETQTSRTRRAPTMWLPRVLRNDEIMVGPQVCTRTGPSHLTWTLPYQSKNGLEANLFPYLLLWFYPALYEPQGAVRCACWIAQVLVVVFTAGSIHELPTTWCALSVVEAQFGAEDCSLAGDHEA